MQNKTPKCLKDLFAPLPSKREQNDITPPATPITPSTDLTPKDYQSPSITPFDEDLPAVQGQKLDYLPYSTKTVPIYANLFKISLTRNYCLYEYSIKFNIDNCLLPNSLKKQVISKISQEITKVFGTYICTGDALFSVKKLPSVETFTSNVKGVKYTLGIFPTNENVEMRKDTSYMIEQYERKQEIKLIYEIIIKDILMHSPSLKYVLNLFGNKNLEKSLEASQDYNNINIMPGFSTRVMIFESGIFLNVDIRTKINSSYNCLQLIQTFIEDENKITQAEKNEVNSFLNGRIVETIHTSQRFKVEYVNFDRIAKDYEVKVNGITINLIKFYKKFFGIDITPKSPLLLLQSKSKAKAQKGEGEIKDKGMYFPPELCVLIGLTEEMSSDTSLLKKISKITKVSPDEKINSITDIINLINDKSCIKKKKNINGVVKEVQLKSPNEKKEEYGIELINISNTPFIGHIMQLPRLVSNGKIISSISKPFQIAEAKQIRFLCIYHNQNDKDQENFSSLIKKAGKSYGIIIGKSDYKAIKSDDPEDWMKVVDKVKSSYNIILVLIDEYLQARGFYELLKDKFQTKGILTQFIIVKSLHKNGLSVMSNLLLQINTKLGGVSYQVKFDSEITNRKMMIIGVDSSQRESTNVRTISFCATLNDNFTKYTSKKITDSFQSYTNTNLPIGSFIYQALTEYFHMNKMFPREIIIYRQGVSMGERKYMEMEVHNIHQILTGGSDVEGFEGLVIPYYFVLVNKKVALKFFEQEEKTKNYNTKYVNPDSGLLVMDKIVSSKYFEFYIQPQKVTQGVATPTNFQIFYGTMNCPKLIPKLTYDLCYLYSNWRGPVRLPAPLKYAEKLAKAKMEISDSLKNSLSFI